MITMRSVKINLSVFIEELLFAYVADDRQEIDELESKFKKIINSSSNAVADSMMRFILKNKLVNEFKPLSEFFTKFEA